MLQRIIISKAHLLVSVYGYEAALSRCRYGTVPNRDRGLIVFGIHVSPVNTGLHDSESTVRSVDLVNFTSHQAPDG
jgi:hypothetical protein